MTMETPSTQLAAKVLDRLMQEKLIRAEDRAKLLPKLSEGKLNDEDWRLAVELSQGKEGEK